MDGDSRHCDDCLDIHERESGGCINEEAFKDPIDGDGGPAHVFCDNESVVNNTTKVESKLNKKHCAIAYHYLRWTVAAGIVTIAWISTKENLADALTKKLSRTTRSYLFGNWTYGCYAD